MATASDTGLACLAAVARHHGLDLAVDRLRHDYAVSVASVETSTLLRMAREGGLRARQRSLSWPDLVSLGAAYPAMAQLANGHWVRVVGIQPERTGLGTALRAAGRACRREGEGPYGPIP